MGKTINDSLDELFDEWKRLSIENGDGEFITRDGIMYKNGQSTEETENGWLNADKRIMFLLKEQNQQTGSVDTGVRWDDDARWWLKDKDGDEPSALKNKSKNRSLGNKFFEVIADLFWGLSKADSPNDWSYEEVTMHYEEVKSFFNTVPFAFVEAKKQPGASKVGKDYKEIAFRDCYARLLMKEISILNPTIIVCMGGEPHDFIFKHYNLVEVNKNIHIDKETGRLIVYSGHPSSYSSLKDIYDDAMYWYRKYLEGKSDK